jgi:hypothetical protein
MIGNRIKRHHLDLASMVTLAITVILFIIAIFTKGLTHELLLEAGIFLISLKLVLSSSKSELSSKIIEEKIDRLLRSREK